MYVLGFFLLLLSLHFLTWSRTELIHFDFFRFVGISRHWRPRLDAIIKIQNVAFGEIHEGTL